MARPRTTIVSVGQRFGRLVRVDDDKRRPLWKCDCGTEKRIDIYSVTNGRAKSCGCYNAELVRARAATHPSIANQIVGQRFGRLVVLRRKGEERPLRYQVVCACECGNEWSGYLYSLTTGYTKSCGCMNKELTLKRNLGAKHHIDLTGQRYGRLTVLSRAGTTKDRGPSGCVAATAGLSSLLQLNRCAQD